MRFEAPILLAMALGLAACDGKPAAPTDSAGVGPDSKLLAEIDTTTPYAGAWASEPGLCGDEKKVWTIEPARMAVGPELRFCAFEEMMVNGADDGATRFATAANCLAKGRQTRDYVFFRLNRNLREMRVTFNDADSIRLVRCPTSS